MTLTNGSVSQTQPLTVDEAFALGVEAYIYGYPLLVLDSLRRVKSNVVVPQGELAPMGQFAHHRAFPGASDRSIAGASLDTLYSLAWIDLSGGPFVLRLPGAEGRFYMLPILDAWTEVIGNPGTRTTGATPAEYVITGPGWTGRLPAEVEQIKSGTNMVFLVGRTYCSGSEADYQAVHALQDQYTLVPLSHAAEAEPELDEGAVDPTIDMTTPPRDQIDHLSGPDFFDRLAMLLRSNPPTIEDAPVVDALLVSESSVTSTRRISHRRWRRVFYAFQKPRVCRSSATTSGRSRPTDGSSRQARVAMERITFNARSSPTSALAETCLRMPSTRSLASTERRSHSTA
jgi:hypothetical protein